MSEPTSATFKSYFKGSVFYCVTAIVATVVVCFVPQVTDLITQLPYVAQEVPVRTVLYVAFIVLIGIFYAAGAFFIVPTAPRSEGEGLKLIEAPLSAIRAVGRLLFLPRLATRWLPRLARQIRQRGCGIAGGICLVTGVAAWMFGTNPAENGVYMLSGAVCRTFAFASVFLLAPWFFIGLKNGDKVAGFRCAANWTPIPKSGIEAERESGWLIFGKYLSWQVTAFAVGECLWILACTEWLTFRLYTVWALFHLIGTALALARMIDHMDNISKRVPYRLLTPIVVFCLYWISPLLRTNPHATTAVEPEERSDWLTALENRVDQLEKHKQPIVIVTSQGGGSRAAMYTAMVMQLLERTEMRLTSLNEPPLSKQAGNTKRPTWADRVLMVSGVSGGSMGLAHWLMNRDSAGAPRHHHPEQLLAEMIRFRRDASDKADDAVNSAGHDEAADLSQLAKDFKAISESLASKRPWVVDDAVVDTSGCDNMAPILRGLLTPTLDRGDALAAFWDATYGWAKTDQQRYPADGSAPLAFFNATDVDNRRRVIIGFPELTPTLFSDAFRGEGDSHLLPVPASRFVDPASGEQLPPLKLSVAVQSSANFPWAFRVRKSPGTDPGEGANSDQLALLDGGIVDNTGIDSVYFAFKALHRMAQFDGPEKASLSKRLQDRGEKAKSILDRIRRLGVVFIEIDSEASGVDRSRFNPLAVITDPAETMVGALFRNADRTLARYRSELQNMLSLHFEYTEIPEELESLASQLNPTPVPTTVWHAFRAKENNHPVAEAEVMLALSLSSSHKAKLMALFLEGEWIWNRVATKDLLTAQRATRQLLTRQAAVRAMVAKIALAQLQADSGKDTKARATQLSQFGKLFEKISGEVPRSGVKANVDLAKALSKDAKKISTVLEADPRDLQKAINTLKLPGQYETYRKNIPKPTFNFLRFEKKMNLRTRAATRIYSRKK